MLLTISYIGDKKWLGNTALPTGNPVQADAVTYFATKARATTPGTRTTADDVCRLLVKLWNAPARHDWVETERTWMVDMLMEGVHTTFGEAAGLADAIEILAGGKVLTLPEEMILMMQAGAHVANRHAKDGSTLPRNIERRLVFGSAQLFLKRRSELPEGLADPIGEEVARCVVIASMSFAMTTDAAVERFAETWKRLVDRERWDSQNYHAIIRAERQALDDVEAYLVRCREYLGLMDSIPLDEEGVKLRGSFRGDVNRWSAETSRLRGLL